MNSINLVFLIQNFSRGAGSERATALIANALANAGYDITIVSICGNNTSFYSICDKVKLYTLIEISEVDNKRYFFRVKQALKNYFDNNRVDLVIDVFASMSIYTNLLKKEYGFKNITWEHYNHLNSLGFYRICRAYAIRKSDYYVTLTRSDMQYYIRKGLRDEKQIGYIYNPSPFPVHNIDFKEKENIVLAVGRLVKLKGYEHLIDIWEIVEKNNDNWNLVIVGDGEERNNLEKLISKKNLDRVNLVGEVKNVEEFYKRAKINVSTSDIEGLPMSMIEAQSFGLAIVSYDYETGPKDIISNKKNGYIVNAYRQKIKDDLMANAILSLIKDEEKLQKFSINALNNAKRFEIGSIEKKWIDIIHLLLNDMG